MPYKLAHLCWDKYASNSLSLYRVYDKEVNIIDSNFKDANFFISALFYI
jgi:hypothetical protein